MNQGQGTIMATEQAGLGLEHAVALLAAAVIAVPLFRKAGLGSVLGYLTAGLIIGPFGLGLFTDPEAILHAGELGVVMFLFVIGLEMRPQKLWTLRGEIFGLGAVQVLVCAGLLTVVGIAFGFDPIVATIGAFGFVLSSTAVIMQMLSERGETASPSGQRSISILLFEDLAIVPLLAGVAIVASLMGLQSGSERTAAQAIMIAILVIGVVIVAGRWLLNPLFRVLAATGAREVMTAAALLVVLGTAAFMAWGGLSMAMGAFLAGVLLSGSVFRHQLEADIEPFRGILLGLFFLSVGMALDLSVVLSDWQMIALGVVSFMAVKAVAIYGVARLFKADNREALTRAALFAQGGEFAFVLYAAASAAGLFDARANATMTAIVILSMALTPLVLIALRRLMPRPVVSTEGVDTAEDLHGRVLMIGFGRFAQVVSQPLLARGVDVSLIENDVEMIQAAAEFGFKVYYGDGTRLDVLRASGAGETELILVCVDKAEAADHIVTLCKAEFPHAKVLARAYDRGHALRLIAAGADFQLRETLESAMVFGREALRALGIEDTEAEDIMSDVRRRDEERLELQIAGGMYAGRDLMRGNAEPVPGPLVRPRRESRALTPETAAVLADEAPAKD